MLLKTSGKSSKSDFFNSISLKPLSLNMLRLALTHEDLPVPLLPVSRTSLAGFPHIKLSVFAISILF